MIVSTHSITIALLARHLSCLNQKQLWLKYCGERISTYGADLSLKNTKVIMHAMDNSSHQSIYTVLRSSSSLETDFQLCHAGFGALYLSDVIVSSLYIKWSWENYDQINAVRLSFDLEAISAAQLPCA